jgi:hypothetical protein
MSHKTYEVWMEQADGQWNRILDNTTGEPEELFEDGQQAKRVAMKAALRPDAVRAVVIERHPCAEYNGPAKRNPRPPPAPLTPRKVEEPPKAAIASEKKPYVPGRPVDAPPEPKADVPAGT